MKRIIATSLSYLSLLFVVFVYSCDDDSTKKRALSSTFSVHDSLNKFYKISTNNRIVKEKRLKAINSFLEGAKNLKIDSLYLKGLYYQAKLFNKYKGPQDALNLSHKLLKLSQQQKDSTYIGNALYRIGYYNKELENYLEAFKHLNQSFKVRRSIYDSINAGKTLKAMSNIHNILGDHNACKTTATDGLKYLENSLEYKNIAGLYLCIALSFRELGNAKEALLWSNKILKMTEKPIVIEKIGTHNIPIFNNIRALILSDLKKYNEAIHILESLLDNKYISLNSQNYTQILSNLGYIKFLKNNNNIESEGLLLKALKIRQQEKYLFGLFNSYIFLAKYYKNKNIEQAKHYAYKAYEINNSFNDYEAQLEALTLQTELEPNSLEHYQHFKKVSLQLMELRKKTREIYAPTKFENENLLKENEKKSLKITAVRNQNTIYLLGILLLFFGIGFVVYFFKQQTKQLNQQNKIVQFQASYDTETRISKRLHDELGNDIFQVMLQYQNDPHNPQIPKKLNAAYSRARDISRENNEFETDETYPEELRNMLQNYTGNNIQLIVRGLDKIDWNPLEQPIKITLYRVLQELMTNMQKHSKASLVALMFANTDKHLTIKYSDNGVGITDEGLHSKNGLRNTEKRMEAIRGTLTFGAEKDQGFKAELKIPT